MKKLFVFILIMFSIVLLFSDVVENWVNVYSNDNVAMGEVPYDIVVDSNRNTYVCGQTGTVQNYDYDAFIQKISPEGETLWFRTFGDDSGSDNWADILKKMLLDEENDALYLVGQYCPPSDPAHPRICLVKMNLEGEFIYHNSYLPGYGYDITFAQDHNLLISGTTAESKLFLSKINPTTGTPYWTAMPVFDDMNGGGTNICVGENGNIYQGGSVGNQWAVVKYDSSGNPLWIKRYESPNSDGDWYPVVRFIGYSNDKIYAVGMVNKITNNDIQVICYDFLGNEIWQDTYDGGYGFDACEGMKIDSEGNIIIAGHAALSENSSKITVLKYSSNGERIWTYESNVNGLEEGAMDVDIDSNNDVYITGYRQRQGLQYPDDYLTQKLSGEDGSLIWEFTYDRDDTTDEAKAIVVFDVNDVFVTGRSHTWNTWYDIVTINYKDNSEDLFENSVPPLKNTVKIYPNPFIEKTNIKISEDSQDEFVIKIYNLKGELIRRLNTYQKEAVWDSKDKSGQKVSSGIYLCKVSSNNKVISSRKIVVIK